MIEEFHKYHKIKPLGYEENEGILDDPEDDIIIEEKIDGANFRFIFNEGKVIFGSRSRELSEAGDEKSFRRCIDFINEKIKGREPFNNFIFYGECCTRHTMAYDWDKIPPYLGFDIYDLKENKFLDYNTKAQVFTTLSLPMVPQIKVCKAGDIKDLSDKDVPTSAYPSPSSKNQQAEGIVLKNYNKQLMAKYVRDEFKEQNAEAFGGNPKYNKDQYSDNDIICHKYCTNPRIDKMIFKLVDEGHKLELPMMKYLPSLVHKDILEEEYEAIVNSKWVVDFGTLRKTITKRCLAVLKQVITNNGLQIKG